MKLLSRTYVLLLIVFSFTTNRALAQGFSPEEAVRRMQVPEGFRVQLVAAEPDVRQPLSLSFDDRGRLWVIQYLQYPTPVGLKPVKVDQYLRTVYDRVPDPSDPNGSRLDGPKPDQIPVAMEFLGRALDEALLFEIASAFEAGTKHRRPPKGFGPLAGEP